ncbi:MAG: MFS transporter [Wenzhouxiangellaceae bacterium]
MKSVTKVWTLLAGMLVMLAGIGLLGTLLGVRGSAESFSVTTLGIIMAGYFAGFVVGPFVIPGLIRAVGHVRVFAAMATLLSACALLHGLLVHAATWFALRLLAGICVVGIYVVIESWLHAQSSNEQRGYLFSVYMTCTLIGLGLGQLLLLTSSSESLDLFAAASVLLSLGLLPVAMTRVQEPVLTITERQGLGALLQISPLAVTGCLCSGLVSGAFWGLAAVVIVGIGMSDQDVAWFMGSTLLGGVLLTTPVGKLSDRYPRRRVLMWISLLTALACVLIWWLLLRQQWLLPGAFVYGAVTFNIYALSAAHANDLAAPEHALETNAGLQLVWGIGASIGPILGGWCMQHYGNRSLLLLMAIAAAVPAIYGAWRLLRRTAVPVVEQGDYVAQFVTSPSALELYPEPEQDADSEAAVSSSDQPDQAEAMNEH